MSSQRVDLNIFAAGSAAIKRYWLLFTCLFLAPKISCRESKRVFFVSALESFLSRYSAGGGIKSWNEEELIWNERGDSIGFVCCRVDGNSFLCNSWSKFWHGDIFFIRQATEIILSVLWMNAATLNMQCKWSPHIWLLQFSFSQGFHAFLFMPWDFFLGFFVFTVWSSSLAATHTMR